MPKHRLQWWIENIECYDRCSDVSGNGVTIALLDSGVDLTHPDLQKCVTREIRIPSLSKISDSIQISHGTAIAGVIAGYPSNDKGILGVAPGCSIISIDITDDPAGKIETSKLIEGINIAIDNNVDIINMSLGISSDYEDLHKVIQRAFDAGIILIASSGNIANESDINYPAKYKEVICVGAKNKNGNLLYPKSHVDSVIFMPGENVASCSLNGKYESYTGTSIATGIATGIIAILVERHPNYNNEKIIKIINKLSKEDNLTVKQFINS